MNNKTEVITDDDFLEWKSNYVTQAVFKFLSDKIEDYKQAITSTILNSELIKPEQLSELNNELVYYHSLQEFFNLTSTDINDFYADSKSKTA